MSLNLPQVLQSKTPKIYKDKKLNNAHFSDFNHNDYQVFLHLISKIGGVDEYGKYLQPDQLKREHALTAKEFSKLFNVSLSNCYGVLKKAVDRLMKADIRIEKPDNRGFWRINVCSMAEYNKKDGYISIKFTDDIMPYLAQVKQKFVLYNLKEIANFGSLYTTRLYELIQEFKDTGYMIKSVVQLREAFAVGNDFKKYNDFKKRTFEHACQEINDNYKLNLGFEEIKEGRKVVAVKFVFKKTRIHKIIDQKTGVERNFYEKPIPQNKKAKTINSDVLEEQLAFTDLKKEAQPMQNILSKVLKKLTS